MMYLILFKRLCIYSILILSTVGLNTIQAQSVRIPSIDQAEAYERELKERRLNNQKEIQKMKGLVVRQAKNFKPSSLWLIIEAALCAELSDSAKEVFVRTHVDDSAQLSFYEIFAEGMAQQVLIMFRNSTNVEIRYVGSESMTRTLKLKYQKNDWKIIAAVVAAD